MLFSQVADLARSLDADAFVARCAYPALVALDEAGALERGDSFGTPPNGIAVKAFRMKVPESSLDSTFMDAEAEGLVGAVAELTPPKPFPKMADSVVHFLSKTTRNPFAAMITVGRSANNDIILGDKSISKLHAYFLRHTDRWTLHDQLSTNGTFVGDQKVDAKGLVVPDGAALRFGPRHRFAFYLPRTLHRILRGG